MVEFLLNSQQAEIPAIEVSFLIGAQDKLRAVVEQLNDHDAQAYRPIIEKCVSLHLVIQEYINHITQKQ